MNTIHITSDDFFNNISSKTIEDNIAEDSSYLPDSSDNKYIFSVNFDLILKYDITTLAYYSADERKKMEKMIPKKIKYSFSAMTHSLKLIDCRISYPYKENTMLSRRIYGKIMPILLKVGIIYSGYISDIYELEYFIKSIFPKFKKCRVQ